MIIYKNKIGYAFKIGSFDSSFGYFIFPHLKSSYKYAWQAEYDGRKILRKMRSVLAEETDAQEVEEFNPNQHESAEDMIISHYLDSYDALVDKTSGVKNTDDDLRDKVYQEIKIVVDNLLKIKQNLTDDNSKEKISVIIGKFSKLVKENFKDFLSEDRQKQAYNAVNKYLTAEVSTIEVSKLLSEDEEKEILESLAGKICKSLQDILPNMVYIIEPISKKIILVDNNSDIKYLTLFFDNELLLHKILPHEYMPFSNSVDFYQNIFKPIFESIGHFKFSQKGILMVVEKTILPDVPNNNTTFDIDCIDIVTKKPCSISISFNNKKWKTNNKFEKIVQAVSSKYTEMDYIANGGAIVECIDPELDSIFGKKGVVIQVAPIGIKLYIDINFGNIIVRLVESQIKIIKDELQNFK